MGVKEMGQKHVNPVCVDRWKGDIAAFLELPPRDFHNLQESS